MYIPYGKQSMDEADIQAVIEVLKSDFLTTGPKIKEFEQAVAEYTGAEYAAAVSNGTAALHAACFAAGIGPGDEVITTPLTFAASANCVLYCGGKPVFADVDKKTYNIDPEEIKKKITDKTKAILPVHLAGQPCDMEAIHAIAREYPVSSRHLKRQDDVGTIFECFCVAIRQPASFRQKRIQLFHLAYTKRTLDIRNPVIEAKRLLLIKPAALVMFHPVCIPGNPMAAE